MLERSWLLPKSTLNWQRKSPRRRKTKRVQPNRSLWGVSLVGLKNKYCTQERRWDYHICTIKEALYNIRLVRRSVPAGLLPWLSYSLASLLFLLPFLALSYLVLHYLALQLHCLGILRIYLVIKIEVVNVFIVVAWYHYPYLIDNLAIINFPWFTDWSVNIVEDALQQLMTTFDGAPRLSHILTVLKR